MRSLVLNRLKEIMAGMEEGLPAYSFCEEDDYIREPEKLDAMSDSDLIEVLIASVVSYC